MKQQIYRSLCLLAIGTLAACGKKSEPPAAVVTPTPTVASTPQTTPTAQPTPVASKTPVAQSTAPALPPSKPVIADLPKSLYPSPTPVAIPVPSEPVKPKPKPTPTAQDKANSKTEPISTLKPPSNPAQQITPVGIGAAKIGMTFQELKRQIGKGYDFKVKANFLEGFDAIAVSKAGSVQYYIPYPTGTQFTDSDRIQHLMTDNPNYRTEHGVGPGTPIGQAAKVYGDATISLSKENESREFINFTQHPSGLAFRPKPIKSRTFVGDYPESNEEYLKTQKYDTKAAIGQIVVSCADDRCQSEPQAESQPTAKQDAKPDLKLEQQGQTEFTRQTPNLTSAPAATSPTVTAPAIPQLPPPSDLQIESIPTGSKQGIKIPFKPISKPELRLQSQSDLKSELNIDIQPTLKIGSQPEVTLEHAAEVK